MSLIEGESKKVPLPGDEGKMDCPFLTREKALTLFNEAWDAAEAKNASVVTLIFQREVNGRAITLCYAQGGAALLAANQVMERIARLVGGGEIQLLSELTSMTVSKGIEIWLNHHGKLEAAMKEAEAAKAEAKEKEEKQS